MMSMHRTSLLDVAPTVAAALGIPVDTDRDGNVLPICLDDVTEMSWMSQVDTQHHSADSADDSVEERLANLGYME